MNKAINHEVEFWEHRLKESRKEFISAKAQFELITSWYDKAVRGEPTNKMEEIYQNWKFMQPRGRNIK